VKACEIDAEMNNIRIRNEKPAVRAQIATYEYFKKKYVLADAK
jgi:hypothetical protein